MRLALIVVAVVAALLAGAYLVFTEGAPLSRGHHVWRATLTASDDGAWRVDLPLLATNEGGTRAQTLDAMYAEMRVAQGNASIERAGARLRVAGQGDVVVEAARSFWGSAPVAEREAFLGWQMLNRTVVREDADGPALVGITIELDHSGGSGHTCWGTSSESIGLGPGERGEIGAVPPPRPGEPTTPTSVPRPAFVCV